MPGDRSRPHARETSTPPSDDRRTIVQGHGTAMVPTKTMQISAHRPVSYGRSPGRPTSCVHPLGRGLPLSAGSTACARWAVVVARLLVTSGDAADRLANARSDLPAA